MNILISKMDIARFGQCPDKMKTYGGFDVAALMIMNLAKAYPQHKFFYIGSNDLGIVEHPDNLIDIETPIRNSMRDVRVNDKTSSKYEIAIDYCKNINLKIDVCLLWYCRFTNLAYYKLPYISKKGTPRKLRQCEQALSHIVAVAKYYNVPTYYLIDDVTELNKIPYDMDRPTGIWSQFNGWVTQIHYTTLEDREYVDYPVKYKPIEKLWLQGKNKVDWRNMKRTNKMIITCNAPSDQSTDKLHYINKWIFSYDNDTIIYGDWNRTKKLAEEIDKLGVRHRFVNKGMTEMEDLMFNTKYTLVIPPSKRVPAFVTQKVYSMIYYGIIPFWCAEDYDYGGIYDSFPYYIKVHSPEELYRKIEELENNEELYKSILNKLYDLLEDYLFDDRLIRNIFDEILDNGK